ncbi:alpha/beta-hydrolase [Zopfia rhizophila CBS 207.26]|uniref:Alpha/beta-hydrolase n=1 Tax=Zopfia rhizophila CBS 207.26 TaxID=1314779 RepID=A0A6A6EQX5_9PEZI|nr:alpha/beta-hydrolase [Zopfia rhizophila CBS 207.26]
MTSKGIFLDVVGVNYKCGSLEGMIGTGSVFQYEPDSIVTFSIGPLVLGSLVGKPLVTISDLLPVDTSTFDPKLINRARLLYSLTPAKGFESPIDIGSKVREVISRHVSHINLDSPNVSDIDPILSQIGAELNVLPKTVAHTRNHLRREAAGFKVMRDIRIPTRDGQHVLGDVYLPLEHGKKYPVLVGFTLYGKRVVFSGPDLENENEIAAFEKAEDDWHSYSSEVSIDNPHRDGWSSWWTTQRGFECLATLNSFSYVPHGYAMVKVDARGVSQTPGNRWVPGEITRDFYDAVEWAAEQSWSTGKVALVGSSYGANIQWNVASLKPKGLECFVPYATDLDMYREAAFTGGIPSFRYLENWFERVHTASPKWKDHMDMFSLMKANPFDGNLWHTVSSQADQVDIPCFLAASQIFIIHGRGAYEAWKSRRPDNTHLQLVGSDYYSWPSREAARKIVQFLDHYLKGLEYPKLERVGIQVRLGHGSWYWRKETNWPVPGTRYTRFHLRADGTVGTTKSPEPGMQFSYSTKISSRGKSGVSFYSSPFDQDAEFAGHFAAVLNVSSSASDADVVVCLWAVDEQGNVVPYSSKNEPEPLAKGFLRASHRKTDPAKSLPERPFHTHLKEDNAPLNAGQVVRIDVEMYPAAARIKSGWRLRVDITPTKDQPDIPGYTPPAMREWYSESHEGTNSVHIGADYKNYILCPVVPRKEGYRNIVM